MSVNMFFFVIQALKANQETPILQCHGRADPLVNFSFGQLTSQIIRSFNNKHDFKVYPGLGHSSCEEVSVPNNHRYCHSPFDRLLTSKSGSMDLLRGNHPYQLSGDPLPVALVMTSLCHFSTVKSITKKSHF